MVFKITRWEDSKQDFSFSAFAGTIAVKDTLEEARAFAAEYSNVNREYEIIAEDAKGERVAWFIAGADMDLGGKAFFAQPALDVRPMVAE